MGILVYVVDVYESICSTYTRRVRLLNAELDWLQEGSAASVAAAQINFPASTQLSRAQYHEC